MNTNQTMAIAKAVYEIVLNNPEGYPSGHLYAQLMDKMDLPTYENLIDLMVKHSILTQKNHLLFAKS
jgi:hypothetical protein